MSQNIIIKNRDNPIRITFSGIDLTILPDIQVTFGADVRTLLLNATSVTVISATELRLDFQDTTETRAGILKIVAFDNVNTDGILITAANFNPMPAVAILQG